MQKMETHPPIHAVAWAMIERNKPKPVGETIRSAGLPVRKGRVKKRGNDSR